ncbi:hypothetical protein C2G38_2250720 [Gigaspora rosea]|uniref:Uncharacterized protein n=1 Tax=Gigaspora rosea TaxID=44941 RepID=A0A397UMX6_9GLOM|nr:hypothetical protein C2G38_2250720 [Gigaspora rosea]
MCHYRNVVHEHDFELVGWHRLKLGALQDQMTVSFSDIERIESNVLPKLIIQAWDIEYIFLYNQSRPLKQYNITSLPINTNLFFEKYGNEISCSLNNFNFILVNSEEKILLEFAKLNYLYQKNIETRETKVHVIDNDIDEQMQKYLFAGLNINNRDIKVNLIEKQTLWAKKTFQNELKHMLAHILKKCKLSGKIDIDF